MCKRYEKFNTISPPLEVRCQVRKIYSSWDWVIKYQAKRENFKESYVPNQLKSDTTPIPASSLAAAICHWVEEQGCDWKAAWEEVVEQARNNPFLQHGYGQLKDPNLAWLFMPSPNRMLKNYSRFHRRTC
jgi:hypothetical protein